MTFNEFWPHYVLLHRRPATRVLHAIGSLAPPAFAAVALARGSAWWLVPIPFVAYGFAWFSHFFVERNRPATWDHFWLSLAADYRMCWLMLTGRMGAEVERAESVARRP
jgi:hypothetical protein